MKREFLYFPKNIHIKMAEFISYLRGYREAPLLQIDTGMSGASDIGIKDFIRFLLGYRGYIRINVK
jgi:hypothetical protein